MDVFEQNRLTYPESENAKIGEVGVAVCNKKFSL